MIAALYVQRGGCYWDLPGVDPWDEERDARNYAGPYPVVAHPPCNRWINFTQLNFRRYGGAHNLPANDGGCFTHALACVRLFGGVLEHPAFSKAWEAFVLQKPRGGGWDQVQGRPGEWVCEVWQSAYGHRARKRTWLYYVGPPPFELRWKTEPGTHQCGGFDRKKPTLSKKEASATPVAFRDELIKLAESVN